MSYRRLEKDEAKIVRVAKAETAPECNVQFVRPEAHLAAQAETSDNIEIWKGEVWDDVLDRSKQAMSALWAHEGSMTHVSSTRHKAQSITLSPLGSVDIGETVGTEVMSRTFRACDLVNLLLNITREEMAEILSRRHLAFDIYRGERSSSDRWELR